MRDFNALEESYKAIQNENYQLRDYIISLQSRLIESQGEDAVPPAPILITHQLPHQTAQQALPSHLLPPPQAQIQQVQGQGQGQGQQVHAPPPAAPTAPMGGSGQGPPTPQMAPQAPMMAAPQAQMMQSAPQAPMMSTPQAPVQQTQQQQQPQPQTQQLVVDNGNAAAKRAFEDDAAFNGYVAKKLRGEAVDATPQQQPSTIPVELRDPKGTA